MSFARDSDEGLLQAWQKGRTAAMERLLDRYQDRVYRFVKWKSGASGPDAEDLAQEVFLQVFRSAHRFGGRSRFRTWLYSVAGNVCRNWMRNAAVRRRHAAAHEDASPGAVADFADERPDPLEALSGTERERIVRQAVLDLEVDHRVILLLREWEELSYGEIADVLDLSLGTVKSRVHHARLKLAGSLQAMREEG